MSKTFKKLITIDRDLYEVYKKCDVVAPLPKLLEDAMKEELIQAEKFNRHYNKRRKGD